MEVIFCNTDFGHKVGEFCPRLRLNYHFISFFRTDFLYEMDGELHPSKGGTMMIIPRGEIVWHGPTPEMTEGFRNDWMHIDGDDFMELVNKYELPLCTPFRIDGSHILSHCIDKIKGELAASSSGYREMCELYLRETVINLHRAYKRELTTASEEKVKNLRIRLIDEHRRCWTLKSMAELCGYSESHLSALYKELYGISPIADLIGIRLENAKMMLTCSAQTVSEICDRVGFSSIYYFSKCFKQNTGLSPTEYRMQFSR